MSGLTDPNKVHELAYRTKYNYYKLKLAYGNEKEKEEAEYNINKIEHSMKSCGYAIENYYDITSILNTMICLLVLPEQNAYQHISNIERDLEIMLPTLHSCVDQNYHNNYRNRYRRLASPKSILAHIKNSLSHDRVMILPQNNASSTEKIKELIFQDALLKKYDSNERTWKIAQEADYPSDYLTHPGDITKYNPPRGYRIETFSISIPAEKMESVVMEIADYLIGLS